MDGRSVTHGRPLARLCGADSLAHRTRAACSLEAVRRPRAVCDLHAREFNVVITRAVRIGAGHGRRRSRGISVRSTNRGPDAQGARPRRMIVRHASTAMLAYGPEHGAR